tara:strand:- start:6449 stop:7057 length:609 start_codon:yes stop_codon:yes gene_type:complete
MSNKLVIFDLDGVLVDACEWHRVALNESLMEICSYQISKEEHYNIFNGIPTMKKLKILTEKGIVEKEQHKIIYDLKQRKTIDIINRFAEVRTEKQEMLKYLKSSGHIIACYTNSIRRTATLMLQKTGILDLFDYLLTNQDVSKPKPDPEGYLFLMNHFGFKANETYIVEDSPKGLAAAHATGAFVFQVQNPEEVNMELLKEL